MVKLFKVSACQDYLTLILNSIDLILTHQHLCKEDLSDLFTLSNFMINTKFRTSKFKFRVHPADLEMRRSDRCVHNCGLDRLR